MKLELSVYRSLRGWAVNTNARFLFRDGYGSPASLERAPNVLIDTARSAADLLKAACMCNMETNCLVILLSWFIVILNGNGITSSHDWIAIVELL